MKLALNVLPTLSLFSLSITQPCLLLLYQFSSFFSLLTLPIFNSYAPRPTPSLAHANCLRSRAKLQVHKKLSVSVGHMLVCITDELQTTSLRLDAPERARTNDVEVLPPLPASTALSILRATNYGLLIKSYNKQKHKFAECACVCVCVQRSNK